jgi:hypothetical protein
VLAVDSKLVSSNESGQQAYDRGSHERVLISLFFYRILPHLYSRAYNRITVHECLNVLLGLFSDRFCERLWENQTAATLHSKTT